MISVLTTTYNRAYILNQLYESLITQELKCLEWIIVDDGSTDNTKEIVEKWQSINDINIKYIYQDNSGKPLALNLGVKYCQGNYTLIVDSDDYLTKEAAREVVKMISHANVGFDEEFSGVCFRREYQNGDIIGNNYEKNQLLILSATDAGAFFKGDLAYCFKTEYLIKYPFPSFENEKFVPELYIWNKITDESKVLYNTSKSIYVCEYLADGLSAGFKKQLKLNPRGFLIFYYSQIFRERGVFNKMKNIIRCLQCLYYLVNK